MKVRSIRRIVADSSHNMCTGAQYFQEALYVGYRQGDAHVCRHGKINVIRSRDEGVTFDHVATFRGEVDTRDAHLYEIPGRRLYVVGFEAPPVAITGTAWTENGLNWSPWTRYTGADGWWLWHPEYYEGRYYCAGYTWDAKHHREWSAVGWFESDDGVRWQKVQTLCEGEEQPNECSLAFAADGTAVVLVRREHRSRKPVLMRAAPPYRAWDVQELDVALAGPCLWLVDDQVWFSGRWFLHPDVAHQGVFRLVNGKPDLRMVLPSGPEFDFSYMGVARHPLNSHRVFLSYYSNHAAPDDPHVCQWTHPAIYLVDAIFGGDPIPQWRVADVQPLPSGGLREVTCPDPAQVALKWQTMLPAGAESPEPGFVDAHHRIAGRAGVVFFDSDIAVGPADRGALHLGYDGPVKVWINGREVFAGPGSNPAIADQTSVPVTFRHGNNRVTVALDTNGGKAWGIFGRYEVRQV